jgi:hypothetical protein
VSKLLDHTTAPSVADIPVKLTEAPFMRRLRLHLQRQYVCRLFRNNVGSAWLGKYQVGEFCVHIYKALRIRFGLAPGSSDLIGICSVIVTPDMVGQRVGLFTAIECKSGNNGPTPAQASFIKMVREFGGIGMCVNSVPATDAVLMLAHVERSPVERSPQSPDTPATE